MKATENDTYEVKLRNSEYSVRYKGCPEAGDLIPADEFAHRVMTYDPSKNVSPQSRQDQADAVSANVHDNSAEADGPSLVD